VQGGDCCASHHWLTFVLALPYTAPAGGSAADSLWTSVTWSSYSPRLYNSWLKHCGGVSMQGALDMVRQKATQDTELLTDAFCCSNRDTRHRSATLHRRCLPISVPCHTNNTTDCRQPALTSSGARVLEQGGPWEVLGEHMASAWSTSL